MKRKVVWRCPHCDGENASLLDYVAAQDGSGNSFWYRCNECTEHYSVPEELVFTDLFKERS